jgi:hypothetical protein
MQLLCDSFVIDVIECKDSSLSTDQCKLTLKISKFGKKSFVLLESNHELASQTQSSLCSPEDEMFSEPEALKEERKESDAEEEDADDTEMQDLPEAASNNINSNLLDSPLEKNNQTFEVFELEKFKKLLALHLCLVEGKFRLKNNPAEGLRYFTKVKNWDSRSAKSNPLSSGDIIKVGNIALRVDIRSYPRPISDKRREDILSGKDIGAFEYPNWNLRETMEDRHSVIDSFGKYPTDAFFGIYDGHAGRNVADFISCVFHTVS